MSFPRDRSETLAELVRIGIELASERDVPRLSERVVEQARRLTGAGAGLLFLREHDRLRLAVVQSDGSEPSPGAMLLAEQAEAEPISSESPSLVVRVAATGRRIDAADLGALVVPVAKSTGDVLGVLALLDAGRPFGTDDQTVVRTLAAHAAIALDNARAYDEAREQLRTTTALLAVAQALSRRAPVEEMMRRVGHEVARAVGADIVGAYFLDARKEALQPVAGYGIPRDLVEALGDMSLVLERWPGIQDAMRTRRAMSSADASADPRCDRAALASVPPHSALFAPTVARGEPVGGIYALWWETGRASSRAETRLIEGVAAQVGLALENVDLVRQTETKLRESETLLAVSRALSSTLDVGTLLRHFLRRIATVLDADGVGSYLLEHNGEWLVPLQGYRLPPDRLGTLRALRLSIVQHAFYAEGARTKRPVFSPDAMNDPRIPDVWREAAPHQSELFVPIVAKGRVVGGLVAAWWDRVRDFSNGDLDLIEAIATQAGAALENARLFQENHRRVKELSVLHALSRAVTGELDRRTLIEALHAQVAWVFEARDLLVLLRGSGDGDAVVALNIRDGERGPTSFDGPAASRPGLGATVMQTGLPIRTDDYAGECARHGVDPAADARSVRHWLGVPMTAGDTVLGVVAIASPAHAFTDADEHLLTNIAQLAALALRSARLFEERETAYGELAAAQDQLVRTEKLRALGEMASGVAHDFNNVLAAILGRAQLLMNHLRDPLLREWTGIIDRAAQDGAQTVRRLQEFTRVRRDQPTVPVDLNDVVRGALEMTQSRWRDEPASRNITIELRMSLPPVPAVAGDPAELREALMNLILNAVDAMPGGGVLTVTTAQAGTMVEVTISDTGIGMPESVKARIFDPFFTTKGSHGTGLGLSMTYGILVRHEAHVTVDSEPGRGSTFRLRFPTADGTAAAETAGAAVTPARGTPLRCLVVDDDRLVASVLSDILTSAGHTAIVFTDPALAIERAQVERFDAIFTDLAMPGMAGWQVARAVKAVSPATVVLLMTGYGVELSPEERETRCVDIVLTKPVAMNTILQALARVAPRTTPQGDDTR